MGCSIAAMEAARWWCMECEVEELGGEPWEPAVGEVGGKLPNEGARSARVRRASGQLKPSPIGRQEEGLDLLFWGLVLCVLAATETPALPVEDVLLAVDGARCPATAEFPEGYLPFALALPTRSRNA